MIAAGMVIVGLLLLGSSVVLGSGPIGIAGSLLLWSGVVKVIVLKIWQTTLNDPGVSVRESEATRGHVTGKRLA
jgi:hypothetical protein